MGGTDDSPTEKKKKEKSCLDDEMCTVRTERVARSAGDTWCGRPAVAQPYTLTRHLDKRRRRRHQTHTAGDSFRVVWIFS